MTIDEAINKIVGDQTPKTRNADGSFYVFFESHVAHTSKQQGRPSSTMVRTTVKDDDGFAFFVDLYSTLPKNVNRYTVDDIREHIKTDVCRGFGEYIEPLGLVSVIAKTPFLKPVAAFKNMAGEIRYLKHPEIEMMLKRI